MKHGKKYRGVADILAKRTSANAARPNFPLAEAVRQVKAGAFAKFDESIECSVRLGVDPRHADQIVRGTVILPHGTGKKVRVTVIAKGDKAKEAEDAGADLVGAEDILAKITEGWTDTDIIITTPDMMGQLGKLGRILGPRGLMPNPKSGTVTLDIAKAVRESKAGKVEFRVDKQGNIGCAIGKKSFGDAQIYDNAMVLLDAIVRAKPSAAKGNYLRSVTLSATMSPGYRVDTIDVINLTKVTAQ